MLLFISLIFLSIFWSLPPPIIKLFEHIEAVTCVCLTCKGECAVFIYRTPLYKIYVSNDVGMQVSKQAMFVLQGC